MYRINADSFQSVGVSPRVATLINVDAPERKICSPVYNFSNIQEQGDVIICHNVLDKKTCREIILACEIGARLHTGPSIWQKALTLGEKQNNDVAIALSPRQNLIFTIPQDNNSQLALVDKIIWRAYVTTMDTVSSKILAPHGFTVQMDEGYSLLRYGPDNYYKEHTDYHQNAVRTLSGLLYLNDDFEGGEVNFRRQGLTIHPTPGTIIFFPSSWTHPHTAMPVKSGARYNIVTWWK